MKIAKQANKIKTKAIGKKYTNLEMSESESEIS